MSDKIEVDLIIHGASQIIQVPKPVKGYANYSKLGCIEDGGIAINNGKIIAVDHDDIILKNYEAKRYIDVSGHTITPGLIDPHNHLIYGGSREDEYEEILLGVSYEEIMKRGGGIKRTIYETSRTSSEDLLKKTIMKLNHLLLSGVTTVEAKTGYGATVKDDVEHLSILLRVNKQPIDIIPTVLAHVVPPGIEKDKYIEEFITYLLPQAKRLGAKFVDVFCEQSAFNVNETRKILESGKNIGLGLRIHADEFSCIGCSKLGVELGASSIDHLNYTPEEIIELITKKEIVTTLSPLTALYIAKKMPNINALLKHDAIIALATDHSPAVINLDMIEVINLASSYLSLPSGNLIAGVTINAAKSLGIEDHMGSLKPGTNADIVIWKIPNYRWFGYLRIRNPIHTVIKNGKILVTNE
ncbi:MAG: imidazolonepropionase [Thermoprotei archaeon]